MTKHEAVAELVVHAVQRALAPVLADVKLQQGQIATWEARWNEVSTLRERVAVLDAKEAARPVVTEMDTLLVDVRARLGLLESKGQKDLDIDSIAHRAAELVPLPKDGENGKDGVSVDQLVPVIAAEVLKSVSAIPPPRDGVGVLGALVDRAGHLVVTLSDGTTKDVGMVVGQDADRAEIVRVIVDEVAKFPRPKDGADGLGYEDMTPVYDEHGRLSLKYERGDLVKMARVPCFVDRGVYRDGESYQKGDGATYGGGFFIAQQDTDSKPEESAGAWRLAVKRGRDGKDGKDAPSLPVVRVGGR